MPEDLNSETVEKPLYARRSSPEFKRAFDAWIALDPF